jgi:hypothetical protein
MFFNDPVQAFANLRRAATDDGALRVIAWRSAAENPFMTAGLREAVPLLPDLSPPAADGPGQFAFADPQRVAASSTRVAGLTSASSRSTSSAPCPSRS